MMTHSARAATLFQMVRPNALENVAPTTASGQSTSTLAASIPDIAYCQKVSSQDSTTGAHCAIKNDAEHTALLIAKCNDEWLIEVLGNQIASHAGLPIPRFEMLEASSEHYPELLSKMAGTASSNPCVISEYLEVSNIKEVDGNSKIDAKSTLKDLGRATLTDIVMGNLDRFPIFDSDADGNFGNIVFDKKQGRIFFIDNVATKHCEIDGNPAKKYLPKTQDKLDEYCDKITQWLAPKFPALVLTQ